MDEQTALPDDLDSKEIADALRQYPVRLGVLFGSHARGTPTPQSDVDIGVVFVDELTATERLELQVELIATLTEIIETDQIDITDLERVDPAVGRSALQHGVILLDNPSLIDMLRTRYEQEYSATTESHADRMKRFDSLLDRLEGRV